MARKRSTSRSSKRATPRRTPADDAAAKAARRDPISRRSQIVWASLVAAMTGVGGLLFAVGGGPGPSGAGVALPALLATGAPNSLEAIFNTRSAVEPGTWQAIVIHDSGSPVGTPASLDEQARSMNLQGLGHHFVVGNGNGIGDGEIHIGYRWLKQSPGAHTAGSNADWYNRNAIGICLIGDGSRQKFSPAQVRRLTQLVDTLCRELDIPADRVFLHRDVGPSTSPGRLFPEAAFREALRGSR